MHDTFMSDTVTMTVASAHAFCRHLLTASAFLLSASAWADEPVAPAEEDVQYVAGLNYALVPAYPGAQQLVGKLRPVWAVKWGRFRISTSRASGLMGFGASGAAGSGASADLVDSARWKLNLALRFDTGRQSSDSPNLAGLPDIDSTLRARLTLAYNFSPAWGVAASYSRDVLGKGGGALGGLDLGYRAALSPKTEWTASVGVGLADQTAMRSYFGVTPEQSLASGHPAFAPSAGLRDVHASVGATTALTGRWFLFGGIGAVRLVGDAAASPLTLKPASAGVSIGAAYRCCR